MTTPLLNELTACEAADLLGARRITSEALVHACLERIVVREPAIRAWASLDRLHALEQAKARDAEPSRGPLHGIPVAIKDVFDTADMPTEMGSPIYKGYQPRADAAVVALLRAAGAVILGKTVTAEFAGMAPSETLNPHNPAHTPGGSSSGSGAAVADRMVPIALGTQTGGSVQRPASYCGAFGFKPTFGRINRAGMKFAAESLDTVGWIARSVGDLALVDAVLSGTPWLPLAARVPARIGLCRTYLWDKALPETRDAVQDAAQRLAAAGVVVEPFELPAEFSALSETREIINDYERARALAHEWATRRQSISPQLSRSVSRGYDIPHARYIEALRFAERMRLRLDEIVAPYDALIAPCVNGEAPEGLAYAGDPSFQALWTLLHVPTVGLPTRRGPKGLPVSIQVIGARHADAHLLEVAGGIWNVVAPAAPAGCN